jgi:hypothetical protein
MRRNLTYADWSDGAASPSAIGERHLALFGANPVLEADGPYGSGDYLFYRKVMDATISDRLAAIIAERKVTHGETSGWLPAVATNYKRSTF